MTRQGDFDLSGANFYNENGGVVQGQICGTGLMNKLLRNNKQNSKKVGSGSGSMSFSENPLLYTTKEPSLCMSPVTGMNRKIVTRYRSNTYENMNGMSHDTESCSSSEGLFSETSSGNAALHQTIEEIQQPMFVAQFDPMALSPPASNNPSVQKQHPQQQGGTPRKGIAWASSLPAVMEEQDSHSAQGSEQETNGIWRGGSPPAIFNAIGDEAFRTLGGSPDSGSQCHQQHFTDNAATQQNMQLHDSDRVGILPPDSSSSPITQEEQQQQIPLPVPKGNKKSKREQKKPSKQQQIREAMERRIQQAMTANIAQKMQNKRGQQSVSFDAQRVQQAQIDMFHNTDEQQLGVSYDGGSTTSSISTDHHHHSNNNGSQTSDSILPKMDLFESAQANSSFLSGGHSSTSSLQSSRASPSPQVDEVTRTMQDLLLQQQMSLKEMSLQNYNYRKELVECQDICNKWKAEREKQQTTIEALAQEKETFEKEAQYLRGEMSAIRSELEELRKERQLHAEFKEYQSSTASTAANSRTNDGGTSKEKKLTDKQEHQTQRHVEESSSNHHQTQVQNKMQKNNASVSQPKMTVTISTPEKVGSNKPVSKAVVYSQSKPEKKPLVSGFKSPTKGNFKNGEARRTVKFHDPPSKQEWTSSSSNLLHDDSPVGISTAGISPALRPNIQYKEGDTYGSCVKRAAEARQQENVEVKGGDVSARDSKGEKRVQVWEDSSSEDQIQAEVAAVYKYRLEAIQKNRQQRSGRRHSSGKPSTKLDL